MAPHQAYLLHNLIINILKCYLNIAGDSGYPLERHLMLPVSDPCTRAEHTYNNKAHSRRVIVEQTILACSRVALGNENNISPVEQIEIV